MTDDTADMPRVRSEEPPEEPGWYWMTSPYTSQWVVVEVRPCHLDFEDLMVVRERQSKQYASDHRRYENAEWTGPIPEPESMAEEGSDATEPQNATFASAPWEPERPTEDEYARVWASDGDLVATVCDAPVYGETAYDRARLIAVAGTAAGKLPDEYSAINAVQALPDLVEAAEFAERRGHDRRCDAMISEGRPCSCGWQEYRDALTDALDAARGG